MYLFTIVNGPLVCFQYFIPAITNKAAMATKWIDLEAIMLSDISQS